MKKLLLALAFAVLLTGCGKPGTEPQTDTPPTPGTEEIPDVVESGSSVWGSWGKTDSAKFDIDNDGTEELVFLDPGPTSGVFTIMLTAAEDNGRYEAKYQTVFRPDLCDVSFEEKDGAVKLRYRKFNYENWLLDGENEKTYGEEHFYDIAVKDNEITLTENGEPFEELYR